MAGEWIKIRNDLDDDPHVIFMWHLLGNPDMDLLIGKLRKFWRHADRHTTDGFIRLGTEQSIDLMVGMSGFTSAMIKAGWLALVEGGAQIIRFADHNGKSTKQRLLATLRQQKHRGDQEDTPQKRDIVTLERDKNVTERHPRRRRENREEELGEVSPNNPSSSEPQAASEQNASPEGVPNPIFLVFPVVGGKATEWPLLESKVREYEQSFPGVNVRLEARLALQWCRDNERKRKTPRGMPVFLNKWFTRNQDRGGYHPGPAGGRTQEPKRSETPEERIARLAGGD